VSSDEQGGYSRGLTAADVVNDGAKVARVRVDGAVNGKPFTVERSTRRYAELSAAMHFLEYSGP
jgi:hypothetical protein